MYKTILVGDDVATGAKMLGILDRSGLTINVAMWSHLAEYDDWRYLLSSRSLDKVDLVKAYRLVHEALDQAEFPLELTPTLLILKMTDPFVRALRQFFGKAKSVEGMRLGGQMIGDRFLEEGIAYRIR